MVEFQWNDRQGRRDRPAFLLVTSPEGEVRIFKYLPEWEGVILLTQILDSKKEGKWSNTTYGILTISGVNHVSFHSGWETGTFREGLLSSLDKEIKGMVTWDKIIETLPFKIKKDSLVKAVSEFWPNEAKELIRIEEFINPR